MEVDSWLTGRRGICLPFTDECGPLFREPTDAQTAWTEALRLGRQRHWKTIECRDGTDWLPGATPSTSFFGHTLHLERPEAELWKNVSDATRRAIRKARQSNLTIEITRSWTAVRQFYTLVCSTRRRQGLPPQPLSFFWHIYRQLFESGAAFLVMAKAALAPIAGAMFFRHDGQALYKFGASEYRHQHLRANNLVMWEAIRHLRADGAASLDFGRTSLGNEGLRRFKQSWGAAERTIAYFKYDLGKDAFVTSPDRSSGLHSRVFRALPLPAGRLVGRLLYRHIA